MKRKFVKKLFITFAGITTLTALIFALAIFVYLKVLPQAVSNPKIIGCLEQTIKKYTNLETEIINPSLKTSLTPVIELSVDGLKLSDGEYPALNIHNFDTRIDFSKVLKKQIVIDKINLRSLYADVNKITEHLPKQEKPTQKSDWIVDIFHSKVSIDNTEILYNPDKLTTLNLRTKNIKIDDNEAKKYVKYNLSADIIKGKNTIKLKSDDNDHVYIENKEKLVIDGSNIFINQSNVKLRGALDSKYNYNFNFTSKNFQIPEVLSLLNSQIVENNINEQLVFFKNIDGNFDFDIKISNKNLGGEVSVNKLSFNLEPLANIPITLNSGKIKLNSSDIKLRDFKGYYGKSTNNSIEFGGTVNDYMKSVDTDIKGKANITNEFAKYYLSKLINYPIELEGNGKTGIKLKSKFNKIDLVWLCGFKKGNGLIIDGEETFMNDAANRVMAAKMHFEDMLLNIKSIDYYAGNPEDDREQVRIPILSMNGNIDFSNGQTFVKDFGVSLPKPMPSGFLNAIMKEKLFKGGTFTGDMRIINTGKYPTLEGDMKAEKVAIPSQRLFIRNGEFKAEKDLMKISSNGRYRRSAYTAGGAIVNELKLPIIVKDINLDIDNINVEKYLQLFNNQTPSEQASADMHTAIAKSAAMGGDTDDEDTAQTFDLANLIIENCVLKAQKGFYKDIHFSDVSANLSLDKNSNLKISSNKFNIAEGTSSAKIECDLKNHKYDIKLGIRDVNSDIIATSLLNLSKEISGKASGLIHIETDDSLKLNGKILFKVNNGTIGKVGLVEYLMKVASLFRNPLTMISPTVISDLVNIPEGKFDKIEGELTLKDNIVMPMKIKSSAPQLSSYIIGTYNLEKQDAALRIYTKFSNRRKGLYGFFRNISLNTLANRIPLSSRNDSNYYDSEISQIPPIDAEEKDCQIFLTKVDGDIEHNNFISSLKKIK